MNRNHLLRSFSSILFMLVLVALTANPALALTGGPDSFGYSFSDSSEPDGPAYNFEDISGTGTGLTLADDVTSGAVPIGFDFNFYGTSYSVVYVSSNGFLTFLPGQPSPYTTVEIPNAAAPNGMVAGWWTDLNPPAGGSIQYEVLGTEPYRRFILQYTNVPHFPWLPSHTDPVTFQMKLFESTNVIEVHYVEAPTYASRQNSSGIENQDGTVGLSYHYGRGGLSTPLAVRYVLGTPPTAADDNGTGFGTNEDTSLMFDVAANDTDADGNLDVSSTNTDCTGCGLPANGSLTNHLDGTFTYTPNTNYHGADSFTYQICDTTNQCDTALVSLVVNPVNDAPLAGSQTLATDEDTPLDLVLTGSDVDGDSLSFAVVTPPAHGTLTGTAPDLTYTPDANFHGADSFTFAVNDGTVDSAEATVDLTVNSVGDAPVADNQSLATNEDTPLDLTLTGSDGDGDSLTFAVVTPPAHGTLTGTAPDLTYTPDENYHGADSFTFTVNDGTVDSLEATISLTVNPVNDAPAADGQSPSTDEDTPLSVTLTGSDVDGDSLTFAVVTPPAHGTLTGTAPDLTYTPDENYHGPDSFTFTVNDGTVDSTEAAVDLTVNPVNDTPVAESHSLSTDEDTPLAVTLTGSDVDGDSLTFAVITLPAHGTLTGTAPDLTYTPDADYNGADSFTFTVNDGTVDSTEGVVSIDVNSINDDPVVNAGPDQGANEGEAVNFQGSFVDAGLRAPADGETLEWNFGDGATAEGTLTPSHTYADEGVYVVTLTVTDTLGGFDSDTLVVTVHNIAPVFADDTFELEQVVGLLVVIDGTFTDPGWLDVHTVEITWEPGVTESLDLAADEDYFTFDYTYFKPGVYPVTVTISDGDGGSTSQVYQVTITGSIMYFPTMLK